VDVDELREMVDETTAALMITNPNTCGVYERNIKEIAVVLHEANAFHQRVADMATDVLRGLMSTKSGYQY